MLRKAKTSPTGYIALIQLGDDRIEFPVVKFDDAGHALVLHPLGHLVRATSEPGFVQAFPMLQTHGR